MSYIKRHMAETVKRAAQKYPVVLVTGARQTGKTMLLRETFPDHAYVTMDNPALLNAAVSDPDGFFDSRRPPVVVDEIQYAPGLFRQIKLIADDQRRKGLFYLSGSQQFNLMKDVTETLAGRVGILNLLGFSRRELEGSPCAEPFTPVPAYYERRKASVCRYNSDAIWKAVWRGSYPEMWASDINEADWDLFFSSYVSTYIERDVRQLVNIGDERKFFNFLTALAARTGQLLNHSAVAGDLGVSVPTVERWVSVLQASGVVYLLQPYYHNALKRAVKTPKLYFLDSGLACWLLGWTSPRTLERGAAAGAIFEGYVIAEILKSYTNAGLDTRQRFFFYRDKEQHEIDLLIHQNGTLYPVEIKKSASPRIEDITSFRYVENLNDAVRGPGALVCLCDTLYPLGPTDTAVPLSYI